MKGFQAASDIVIADFVADDHLTDSRRQHETQPAMPDLFIASQGFQRRLMIESGPGHR